MEGDGMANIERSAIERASNAVIEDGFYRRFNLNPEDWDEVAGRMLQAVNHQGAVEERDEALRLLANATDPENADDWDEAREVGWAYARKFDHLWGQ